MSPIKRRELIAGMAGTVGAMALSACSAGSLGSSSASGSAANVTITYQVDNGDVSVKVANALISAFNALSNGVTVKLDTHPAGTDGDNAVKTKLATGDMAEVFSYNSGSLMAALDPAKNLVPMTSESYMSAVEDSFKTSVTYKGEVYGVPMSTVQGGGILYNKAVFKKVGISVPKSWAEFMANNAKIKAAGIDPVIQTYGDTWSSQLFVLADFHNISATDPKWADNYTANKAKYVDQPALSSFQRLEDVHKAGYLNKDFASAKVTQGAQYLVQGTGAQFPMLSGLTSTYVPMSADASENIGFYAQPGDSASTYGLTVWTPAGVYMIKGSALPSGLPTAVTDLQKFVDDGNVSPALEFLSPIKGPNLEKITVEVGSGITSAVDGAKRYDEDVKKQAQQLGLAGW